MATNQDFNNLIDRIDTATTTLENSVQALSDGSADIEASVQEAQQAANTATQQAGDAGQSATTATQAAGEAASSVQEVEGIIQDFEQSNLIGEAPVNGQEYVRKDAEWVLNTGGEGGGGGDVVSVNGVLPDAQGDVSLDIPDAQVNSDWEATEGVEAILNKPELFSGDYDDLTNKPSIPTQGVVSVVAGDNITVDNTDPLNPVISSEGGGGEQGYPLDLPLGMGWSYDGQPLTHWPHVNPHDPIELNKIGCYAGGRWEEGMGILNYSEGRSAFPVGKFYVSYTDDPVGSTGGLMTVTWGAEIGGTLMTKIFRFTPEPKNTTGDEQPDYIAIASGSNALRWKPVVGESSGGGGVTSVNNQTPDAQGNVTVAIPTKTSQLTNDSGFITANDIPSGGGIEEAPNDGKQYARQNESWTEVEAGGGGGTPQGYPVEFEQDWYYDSKAFTHWPDPNPFNPIELNKVAGYAGGAWQTGKDILTKSEGRRNFPTGLFYVTIADDPVGTTGGLLRVTRSAKIDGAFVGRTYRFTPEPSKTAGDASPDYIAVSGGTSLVWKPIGGTL